MQVVEHRPLCTLVLAAEGRMERCPEDACGLWSDGCPLERVAADLLTHPDAAALLLALRRAVESDQEPADDRAAGRLRAALGSAGRHAGPATGSTELV